MARARRVGLLGLVITAALSGCVVGSGPCLWLEPVKHTLTGRVHFRDFPAADGVDNVPVLLLDKTAYVYAPAESTHCQAANDVQLVGLSEFPQDVIENTHVVVEGRLFEASAPRQHTRFLINVTSILPVTAPHPSPP